ncbi:innexin unc-7-like [Pecten maximus]|uniref:innexin unc-7-like n=1 Tax=Pecten maximus TaxID=6579 RepID=UPI0014580A45|nr:innexin unc-7-like [Pecten maximus]XP_033732339.1 innexin unc-7-like [Pecten maximus]
MVWRPFVRHLTQSSVRLNDQCGRLNSTWTVGILVLFAVLTYGFQFSQDDLVSCWTPQQFTHQMVAYTNRICSDTSTYYVPMFEDIPIRPHLRETKVSSKEFKWRWLPLILLIQALLFKLPDLVLSVGQGLVGFRFTKISGLTDGYETLNMADRAQMGRQVGRYMKSWIDSTVLKGCPWGWLTLLFLFTKLLYFINIVTQVSVMNGLLKSENHSSFGKQVLNDIVGNETVEWHSFDSSPDHIIMCDFQIRLMSNVQRYTVQCVLSNTDNIMHYYKMMLSFLWLWLVGVTVITTISGVIQLLTVLVPVFRKRYIKSYLYMSKEVSPSPSDNDISRFAGSEITEDGVFILKAIGEASSEHLVRDAVIYLWHSTHDQHSSVPQGPPEHGGPPPYLTQGPYVPGQTYGPGGTVLSPPPTAPQQVRYRPQTGTEAVPLMPNPPM